MQKSRMSLRMGAAAIAVTLLVTAGFASASTWLHVDQSGIAAVKETTATAAPTLTVEASNLSALRVSAQTSGLTLQTHENKTGRFMELGWPDAPMYGEVGSPGLPVIRGLFIAPAGALVSVSYELGNPVAFAGPSVGAPEWVYPVQAPVEKVPGAIENAVFAFNPDAYSMDADLPAVRVVVQELGIVRGQRLCLLEIRPVSYNPVSGKLFFWPDITANIKFDGGMSPRNALSPMPGLSKVVLNPEVLPATRGSGNYLIVVANAYTPSIAAFATAKTAQGFTVSTYSVAPGTSNTQIKTYIQGLWGGPNAPDYILLVGDSDTIPTWVGGGEGTPNTDIQYACMDGASDWYPDIAIGRFSVTSPTQLNDIVSKTLYFENGPLADPDYIKRAVFMASSDNYAITEGTHNYVIDTYMLPNEIAADKLYCHTYSATPAQVTASFNNGRFYGIYSGHGSETSWADGPPYGQSDVNALTNHNLYACVYSFACLTGDYVVGECFMETWLRAPNKGAAVAIGSSVTSYWTEDDILERVLFDAIYDESQPSVPKEIGPIWNEAKTRFLAHFGPTATTRRYFEMYNIMGDPSLAYPGNCSDAGTIQLDATKYACEDTAAIRVLDCGLNLNPNVADTATVTIASTSETAGETVTLTETNPNSALFQGSIGVSQTNAAGVLFVAPGDMVTATYIDADDGQGHTNVVVTGTAVVDCTPPTIDNVHAINIQPRSATVTFDCDEVASGTVHYGLDCGSLTGTASGGFAMSPTVDVTGLQDNTTYFYTVEAQDEAGNVATDDNGGACYTFSTPEVPEFFTELFTAANDLDNLSLLFVPNGSIDYYAGCVVPIIALPTDPTGGTTLTMSDDASVQVTLTGASVMLYGQSYTSFYVCSNGYITFGISDTTYTETLADHFSKPRVAALFDDLNPTAGGTVSWKQLSDHVAVTWLNVAEYQTTNQNTFQIELYFDGRITINYLAIAVSDGLAGLSRGTGLDPDFFMSDLSNLGSCGPRPPSAVGAAVQTAVSTPLTITLMASDDGLPTPPGVLTYIVTSRPTRGSLKDVGTGNFITAVPYTLAGHGNQVLYTPFPSYSGPDGFMFKANDGGTPPAGGDSNIATISITIGGPQVVYSYPLNLNPGWTTEGQWAWGVPTGTLGDPSSGHTGGNVYGYNLSGQYTNTMPRYYLKTTAINCSGLTQVTLKFWRWLGVESSSYDHAGVEVSNNGTTWTSVWEHSGSSVIETTWTQYSYDISAVANNQATVYVRWAMGTTDGSVTYCGWNIDDIEIWGVTPTTPQGACCNAGACAVMTASGCSTAGGTYQGDWVACEPNPCAPSVCRGDGNCDGVISWRDIDYFVAAMTSQASWEVMFAPGTPTCTYANNDANGDGAVNWRDIDPLVAVMGTSCP